MLDKGQHAKTSYADGVLRISWWRGTHRESAIKNKRWRKKNEVESAKVASWKRVWCNYYEACYPRTRNERPTTPSLMRDRDRISNCLGKDINYIQHPTQRPASEIFNYTLFTWSAVCLTACLYVWPALTVSSPTNRFMMHERYSPCLTQVSTISFSDNYPGVSRLFVNIEFRKKFVLYRKSWVWIWWITVWWNRLLFDVYFRCEKKFYKWLRWTMIVLDRFVFYGHSWCCKHISYVVWKYSFFKFRILFINTVFK